MLLRRARLAAERADERVAVTSAMPSGDVALSGVDEIGKGAGCERQNRGDRAGGRRRDGYGR